MIVIGSKSNAGDCDRSLVIARGRLNVDYDWYECDTQIFYELIDCIRTVCISLTC